MSYKLTRRRFVYSGVAIASVFQLKLAGMAMGMAKQSGICQLSAEQEEGPFHVANSLVRSNIVEGRPGIPLSLRIMLLDARTCNPIPNAAVDLWHCDSLGIYSGFIGQSLQSSNRPGFSGSHDGSPPGFNPAAPPSTPFGSGDPGGSPPRNNPTDKQTFLRGIQITGSDGVVNFRTVFPGFYPGRTNHIHFKVRVGTESSGTKYSTDNIAHTGQIFFPEDIAQKIMERSPYSDHKIHRVSQIEDQIFNDQYGSLSIAKLEPVLPTRFAAGLRANMIASVDLTASPAPVGIAPRDR